MTRNRALLALGTAAITATAVLWWVVDGDVGRLAALVRGAAGEAWRGLVGA